MVPHRGSCPSWKCASGGREADAKDAKRRKLAPEPHMARTGTETQRFGTLRLLPIALAAEATRDRRLSTAARPDDRLPGPVLLPPADPGCAAALGVDRDRAGRLMRPLHARLDRDPPAAGGQRQRYGGAWPAFAAASSISRSMDAGARGARVPTAVRDRTTRADVDDSGLPHRPSTITTSKLVAGDRRRYLELTRW